MTYDWETCLIASDEWGRMIARRTKAGWRMVSASVVEGTPLLAYIFWEKSPSGSTTTKEQ